MKSNYYYAKIKGSFINYLNLHSYEPIRLRNTTIEKESILYSIDDLIKLKTLHPQIEIYEKISSYSGRAY
jgi:hypothetical protein